MSIHTRAALLVACAACGGQSTPPPPATGDPVANRATTDPAGDGLVAYRGVVLTARHYGNNQWVPEWILVRPTVAPKSQSLLQDYRPHGSTVSGQPRVSIGDREPVDAPLTFMGRDGPVVLRATQRVALGISGGFGASDAQWWEAYAMPTVPLDITPDVLATAERIVLDGAHPDAALSIAERISSESGEFPEPCGEHHVPSVAQLAGAGYANGVMYCFDRAIATVIAYPEGGGYASFLLSGGGAVRLDGIPLAVVRNGDAAYLLTDRDDALTARRL